MCSRRRETVEQQEQIENDGFWYVFAPGLVLVMLAWLT